MLQVVYVARNPKDVMVSYYYYSKESLNYSYRGSFENFAKKLMNGKSK